MKFEDALSQMRLGKKIRHPSFADDEYLSACIVGIIGDDKSFEQKDISIVKCKGDRQHDEMAGVYYYVAKIKRQLKKILTDDEFKKYNNIWTEIDIAKIFDNDIFKYPQINLFLLMSDDW